MAKFYAISEADIVGSLDSLTFPEAAPLFGSPNAFYMFFSPEPPPDYFIFNIDTADFPPTANVTSFSKIISSTPVAIGAGEVAQVWKADSGDSYLLGDNGTASTDTFFGLALTEKVGDPTKTFGSEQQINQFFFKFDDKIYGSDEDDQLSGWAGDDIMRGGDGEDEFFYAKGMSKDRILDLNKNDDSVIIDEDLVDSFNALRDDVKLKNGKVVLKFDSSDKLTIFGIESLNDVKNVVAFDDFTDFS